MTKKFYISKSEGILFPKIPILCYCGCKNVVWNGACWVKGHQHKNNKYFQDHKHDQKTKEKISITNTKLFLLKPDGSKEIYPPIPITCQCKNIYCNIICWNGIEYADGHNLIGRIWSEEERRTNAERLKNNPPTKGKIDSIEIRERKRISHLGKHHTEKSKKKNSESHKGSKNGMYKVPSPMKGKKHKPESIEKMKKKLKGRISPMKGRKPTEKQIKNIIDYHERIRNNPELHPNRMMSKRGHTTKPQKKLFELLKLMYSDAELEYPIKTLKTTRFSDIGIPSLKLCFEYDETYWHDKEKDDIRQKEIEEVGWKVIRFTDKEKLSLELIKFKLSELNIII